MTTSGGGWRFTGASWTHHKARSPARKLFLDVAEPAKKAIGAEAVESQAEACLDLATLHKGFGSLRKAETYCGKALEIRKTAANAADLLGCHLALAGTLVLQFDREAETETEVKAALDLAAPDTHEKCEARHFRALWNFHAVRAEQTKRRGQRRG